ncbi:hypothetical protein KUCAC02_007437 [Chaenocephalus aceratus]|uniref:Uncharacterized protein n=1 Tax=Chaenocephalus aceratus TaxID=36190 RepID=A0ACB9X5G1_CHAAC|nr:hypothetical protein KUCAC02_007437 [Chaenocephalus aceratus]
MSMGLLSHFTAAVLLLLFAFLCFYINHLSIHQTRLVGSVSDQHTEAQTILGYYYPARPQNKSVETRTVISRADKCTLAPESRFDCARDRLLSRRECEERGCCYAPLPHSAGPPWCFYPSLYPGYKMGPLTPTTQGQEATLTRATPSYLPKDIATLHLEVTEEAAGCLHLTFKDPSSQRYEVKLPAGVPQSPADTQDALYTIEYQAEPFGFIVRRKSNGRHEYHGGSLLFADQYLQLSTTLASSLVSGLGEHYTPLLLDLNWTSVTLWNRDMAPHVKVMLQPTPALTWVAIGGVLDLYVFVGPGPQSVIRLYLQVIGYPMMPPYWSLGFHLCRWGYTTSNTTRHVAQRMHNATFPMDVQWNDLDYANKRRVFTFDPWRFGDLPQMVDEFHKSGMKYILILDPGISSSSPPGTYPPFDDGLKRDVWPGPTAFPDFTNPETGRWWEDCIRDFHSKVPVDGLWIDMNEPSSFVQGSVEGCPDSDLENPPYTPSRAVGGHRSCPLLQPAQYVWTDGGLCHSQRSHEGDVRSDWEQLRYSIPAVLHFGLFGVPLVGADICGFGGNTTEELCVRWMQLGAFYPFMRNHNDKPNAPQEPYVFGQKAQATMRSALNLRYSLLPFLYTLFHHAHTSADTVARPLFVEFPTDPNCQTIDRQFLWGSSLLISAVLDRGAEELAAYLPPATWYSLHNGQPFYSKGQYLLLPAPLDTINVHVREGHIIPQQEPALTTTASRRNPFLLTVALSAGGLGRGDLFWDDGDSSSTPLKREIIVTLSSWLDSVRW